MIIVVKLFAAIRDSVGAEELKLDLPAGATIADLKNCIGQRYPALTGLLARSAVARNLDYAWDSDVVTSGDELALIPPVSGG